MLLTTRGRNKKSFEKFDKSEISPMPVVNHTNCMDSRKALADIVGCWSFNFMKSCGYNVTERWCEFSKHEKECVLWLTKL